MDRRKFLGLAGGAAVAAVVPIQANPESLEDTIIAIEAMTKPKGVALRTTTREIWPGIMEWYKKSIHNDLIKHAEYVEFFEIDS